MKKIQVTRTALRATFAGLAAIAAALSAVAHGELIEVDREASEPAVSAGVGARFQHDSDPQVILQLGFKGFTEEGKPYEYHRLVVVTGGLGISTDPETGAELIQYADVRIAPYQHTSEGDLTAFSYEIAPVEYRRDLAKGRAHSLTIQPVRIGYEVGVTERQRQEFGQGAPFVRFAIAAVGYTFESFVRPGEENDIEHFVSILPASMDVGFQFEATRDIVVRLTFMHLEFGIESNKSRTQLEGALWGKVEVSFYDATHENSLSVYARGGGELGPGSPYYIEQTGKLEHFGFIEFGLRAQF